ncbi:MAG: hypothetical protein LVR00_07785 [Rhabdochlamydiaceae bacterium]|jgi:hypothetical protein
MYEKNRGRCDKKCVCVFGEAEKGKHGHPIPCSSLPQLFESVGNPPESSQGIWFAIQFLSYAQELLFFRVEEEGFSREGYSQGFHFLRNNQLSYYPSAICLPGVGDKAIIEETAPLCAIYRTLIILSEKDLYDYTASG